jgi:uncharacterized protein
MKKIILLLLFGTTINVLFAQKNITGTWKGKITAQLRLVFHFDYTKERTLFGTLDSPDQGVNGLPLSSVTIKKDSVIVEIDVAKVVYRAAFINDTTLAGTWFQGGGKIPLQVMLESANSNIKIPNRPQTPKPPFSYNSEDVEYDNADKSVHFGATFTYPKSGHHFITAILITGSGLQDRDETIFYHKPFAVIADYLTKKGYAVLRVDDRTMGKSTGDVKYATSADYANDVIAGINYLKTRKETDTTKIGLIGHSEGGLIAPIVYTKWPRVAFIISLAGPGVSGADILLRQQTDPLKNAGINKTAFASFYLLTQKTLFFIHDFAAGPDSIILQKIKLNYEQWKAALPDSIAKALHLEGEDGEMYAKQTSGELQPWLRYFIATDPSLFWQKVKCPVLALDGSNDIQVYPTQNIPAIVAALQKAGNKNITTKIFPGLNHLFQHCTKCTVDEYKEIEETFATEALEEMANWLQKNIKN